MEHFDVNFATEERWEKSFRRALRSSHAVNRAFSQLANACGERDLLRYLCYYTSPDTKELEKQTRSAAPRTKRVLDRTLDTLAKASKQVRDLISWEIHDPLREKIGQAWQYQFTSTLDAYVQRLSAARDEYAASSLVKGQLRHEQILVFLWLRVEQKTGRPHWGDLAHLLVAAYEAHGVRLDLDQFRVREIVQRYKKAHPAKVELFRKHIARGAFFPNSYEGGSY